MSYLLEKKIYNCLLVIFYLIFRIKLCVVSKLVNLIVESIVKKRDENK